MVTNTRAAFEAEVRLQMANPTRVYSVYELQMLPDNKLVAILDKKLLVRHFNEDMDGTGGRAGGFIETAREGEPRKAYAEQTVYISVNSILFDNAIATGNASISSFSIMTGNSTINGPARLENYSNLAGEAGLSGYIIATNGTHINGKDHLHSDKLLVLDSEDIDDTTKFIELSSLRRLERITDTVKGRMVI